jgi:UDP-N-acetylglucosamine:LPS N-acetylglucosamine transferase
MIFFYLIPGQEEKNAMTMVKEGAGIIAPSVPEIKENVLKLKNNPVLHAAFKKSAITLAKPNSCREIVLLCHK